MTFLRGVWTLFRWLVGIPARKKGDKVRPWAWWGTLFVAGVTLRLALLGVAAGGYGWYHVTGSLPPLDGQRRVAGLHQPVRIDRDGLGIPTVHGQTNADLALGLGFVHGQDRFFQMDLSRRLAAGRLAELFGAGPEDRILDVDRRHRVHNFQSVARQAVERLPIEQHAALAAYVKGVNAGLASLRRQPLEYDLLGVAPAPWRSEDSILVLLAMFLDLQSDGPEIEFTHWTVRTAFPPAVYDLLTAPGTEWDAPLRGPAFETPRLPTPEEFDLRKHTTSRWTVPDRRESRLELPVSGSNNWAVAGAHTRHGGALVANDMHLGLRVPNVWYRASLACGDVRGDGATLPGVPGLAVGGNGRVAWGLTNSMGDWSDLVELEVVPGEKASYRTPDGPRPFTLRGETIRVKDRPDVELTVRDTIWGPVFRESAGGRLFALRWAAHDAETLNLDHLDFAQAESVPDLLDLANRAGGPHVNVVAGDSGGHIGWTVSGRVPRRVGFDGRLPVKWGDGKLRWDGYRAPGETPRIIDPPSGRLWTANNRQLDGDGLAILGFDGYDRGARAGQIRDRLMALEQADEDDMLALQLDDRALFLARWRDLLLAVLSPEVLKADPTREETRKYVENWGGRAAASSVGYRLVHEFRDAVSRAVLGPFVAHARRVDPSFEIHWLRQREGAVWKLLQERPRHLLDPQYPDWDALFLRAADGLRHGPEPMADRTWGRLNVAKIRHPLSDGVRAVPRVGGWIDGLLKLDMPEQPLDGGWGDMPRIQRSSYGASQRMVVSPGHEDRGYFHMPCGQSGHPWSPHYRDGHAAWVNGDATPLRPGATSHSLTLLRE